MLKLNTEIIVPVHFPKIKPPKKHIGVPKPNNKTHIIVDIKNIILSWIITLPVTGFISAAMFSYAYYSKYTLQFMSSHN